MITLRDQAIEFIKSIPDDKVIYILDMFKGLKGFMGENIQENQQISDNENQIKSAMGICKKYANIDLQPLEKEAWGMVAEEKYANN